MGYPRFYAVWQSEGRYRSVRLGKNNDSDSLSWFVGSGQFVHNPHDTVKATFTREDFFRRVDGTFERSKTIYPYIERYSLCLPACD